MHFSGKAFLGLLSDTFYADILKHDLFEALKLMDAIPSNGVTFEQLNFEITLSGSTSSSKDKELAKPVPVLTQDEAKPSNTSCIPFDLYNFIETESENTADEESKDVMSNILLYLRYLEKRGSFLRSLSIPLPPNLLPQTSVTEKLDDQSSDTSQRDIPIIDDDNDSMSDNFLNYTSAMQADHFSGLGTSLIDNPDIDLDLMSSDSRSWKTVSVAEEEPMAVPFDNFIDGNEQRETSSVSFPPGSTMINERDSSNMRTRYLERNNKVFKTYRCKHQLINSRQRELLDDNLRFFNKQLLREFYHKYLPLLQQYKQQGILRTFRYNFSFNRTRRFGSFYFHLHFTFDENIPYETRKRIHNILLPFFKRLKLMVQNLSSDLRYYGF
jgi:hypothetical protein